MRREVAERMASRYEPSTSLFEIGCGVGTLTYELERTKKFNITACDTSSEMLHVAKQRVKSRLVWRNGVDFRGTTDVSVICMVMHEMPPCAHRDILETMLRSSRKEVWVVDIDPSYRPSLLMLSGEPFIADYIRTIEATLQSVSGASVDKLEIVKGHVCAWVLQSL